MPAFDPDLGKQLKFLDLIVSTTLRPNMVLLSMEWTSGLDWVDGALRRPVGGGTGEKENQIHRPCGWLSEKGVKGLLQARDSGIEGLYRSLQVLSLMGICWLRRRAIKNILKAAEKDSCWLKRNDTWQSILLGHKLGSDHPWLCCLWDVVWYQDLKHLMTMVIYHWLCECTSQ